jgi:hypothetical protein
MARALVGVPRRRASFALSPLFAAALLLSMSGLAQGREPINSNAVVEAPVSIGFDVSYPQCGGSLPEVFSFAVIGVNGGRVYSPNHCLADDETGLLAWAGPNAELYANTANPGPDHSDHWPTGQDAPRACLADDADSADCAYDYGWNAAADSYANAVAAYVALGWAHADATRTPVANRWWLDVEVANSWRSNRSLNVAALQGAVAYLESMEVESVGFYSAPRMWAQIVGDADAFADHPAWVAGASTLRQARAVCRADGFTGGRVLMAQYFAKGLDANYRCR